MCLPIRSKPKCHFVPRPSIGSPEIPTTRNLMTFGAHNFACRPPIEMRSEEKLYPLSRSFQRYVACHLNERKSGWFLTFSGRESNYQFDFGPAFGYHLCVKCPNGSCEPILDIYVPRSFQWYKKILHPMGFDLVVVLWKFESPPRRQFTKWDLIWECEGSFPHTLLHSREREMWLPSFILGSYLHKPLPWSWTQG
jgi:hypothetical protein